MPDLFVEWTWALRRWCPDVLTELTPRARALRYCHDWTALVEPWADRVVDIDRVTARGICEAVGYGHRTPVRVPPADTNSFKTHPMYLGGQRDSADGANPDQ